MTLKFGDIEILAEKAMPPDTVLFMPADIKRSIDFLGVAAGLCRDGIIPQSALDEMRKNVDDMIRNRAGQICIIKNLRDCGEPTK